MFIDILPSTLRFSPFEIVSSLENLCWAINYPSREVNNLKNFVNSDSEISM